HLYSAVAEHGVGARQRFGLLPLTTIDGLRNKRIFPLLSGRPRHALLARLDGRTVQVPPFLQDTHHAGSKLT
uniref:Uncharacterized protein n=1 Tax=Glossina palpalis gambiensis TaxID=67801 RepID=A0A1B0AL80_9MUSC